MRRTKERRHPASAGSPAEPQPPNRRSMGTEAAFSSSAEKGTG